MILILHGPNLSALGAREPAVYGTTTLAEIDARIVTEARALGVEVKIRQTNHEGVLVDEILGASGAVDGIILNAAAYAHTSIAIADAVRAVAPLPVVEVHLSNTAARGRVDAIVGAACLARIEGLGGDGYLFALRALAELIDRRPSRP